MAATRFSYVLLFGLLLSAGATTALAQPVPSDSTAADTTGVEWTTTLPPLTVTSSRLPTSPAEAPARVTVLDSSALHATGTSSLADALEARAGLFVRRYGNGGLATPSLRGSGASQTTLLLDGQRISDPQIGHLDLSLLPTVLLQSVEVMHGPSSSLHGSDGLGGAIHLHTLQPQSDLRVRGTAQIGAYGKRGGSVLVGSALTDQTAVLAAVDVQTTEGDFPYTDEARFPPETIRRRNADRVRRSAFGRVRTRIGAHHLQVAGWGTWAERGLPPSSSTAPAQERQWDTQLRFWGQDRIPVGNGNLTVQELTQHTRLRYANPAQDLDQTGQTWTISLESTLETPLSDRWQTAMGLTGSYAQAEHPELSNSAREQRGAAYAEGTGQYGRLRLYPALRADTYWMPDGQTRIAVSPRFGLNLTPIAAWPDVHVKAQVGRAFRMPTFNDRYWQPGGNPDLRPERSWGGDLGLRLDRPRGHAEVTVFGHRRHDQIVWQPTGNDYWAPTNVRRVRAVGGEVSAEWVWSLPVGLSLQSGLTYTITDARNRTNPESAAYNEPLRYVPRDQMKARATLSWGPAALTLPARYTGRRYVTSDGTQFLDEYVLINPRLRLEQNVAGIRTELSLQIENALNVDYESVGGRPMPPRHAQVRLLVAP